MAGFMPPKVIWPVLEGAVYGLFAEADLVHPDGKTGVVYQKDDLVAVASTDKNGDASFL